MMTYERPSQIAEDPKPSTAVNGIKVTEAPAKFGPTPCDTLVLDGVKSLLFSQRMSKRTATSHEGVYSPLQNERQFRLLVLSGEQRSGELKGALVEQVIGDALPYYWLSYTAKMMLLSFHVRQSAIFTIRI